jgi:ketosteroid isomerase-like protein
MVFVKGFGMTIIFEQPWVLLAVAFVALVIVYFARTSFPEKSKWWHLLIPVLIAGGAFGLDHLVKTDHEKIVETLERLTMAVMEKDVDTISGLISDDYSDRYHRSKSSIMGTSKYVVRMHKFKSIVMTFHEVIIDGETADAEILVRLRTDSKESTMPTPELSYVRLKLVMAKKADGNWRIESTGLVEYNNQPVSWKLR